MNILTINAGSSSIKYKVFDMQSEQATVLLSGLIEGIGEVSGQWHHDWQKETSQTHHFRDHHEAFSLLAMRLKENLRDHPIEGIGHRVVHGGQVLFRPTRITQKILQTIEQLSNLAPIHNPVNAQGIRFALDHFPNALQVAIFDSGFHHTMPDYVSLYAIEKETALKLQIRRYGFHGINHEYVALRAAKYLKKSLSDCNLISLHLGNGASACLIKDGQSHDTSMGMTPLPGLIMGTRCGDIDPAIVLYLLKQGYTPGAIDNLLNKQSGLKGMAGDNDMRNLLVRCDVNDKAAILAVEQYVYSIQKIIGAYLSQLPRLDALIFTGGVGENAAVIREQVIAPLQHFKLALDQSANTQKIKDCQRISSGENNILVIRGNEELLMAQKVMALMGQ